MKRFKIEQSTADIVSQSGLAPIGQTVSVHSRHRFPLKGQIRS